MRVLGIISRKDHKEKRRKGREEALGKPLFAYFADAFAIFA
jgi:hypothetical protein